MLKHHSYINTDKISILETKKQTYVAYTNIAKIHAIFQVHVKQLPKLSIYSENHNKYEMNEMIRIMGKDHVDFY